MLWLAPVDAVKDSPKVEHNPGSLADITLGGIYASEADAKAGLSRFPAPCSYSIIKIPIGFDMFANIEMTRVEDATEGEKRS